MDKTWQNGVEMYSMYKTVFSPELSAAMELARTHGICNR